jgi:hypothetical protein
MLECLHYNKTTAHEKNVYCSNCDIDHYALDPMAKGLKSHDRDRLRPVYQKCMDHSIGQGLP